MEKIITIEGKEYEEYKLTGAGVTGIDDNLTRVIHPAEFKESGYKLFRPIQTPEFKVGMRVEYINKKMLFKFLVNNKFTENMVYRIAGSGGGSFYLLDDNGIGVEIKEEEFAEHFKPYEKPKEGDRYYVMAAYEDFVKTWRDDEWDNARWNLGLAFKTKEQAEFARERLSKLF